MEQARQEASTAIEPAQAAPFALVCDSRDRETWLQMRHGYVGASEASSVLGLNPHGSAYSLWAIKTGQVREPDVAQDSEAAFWGIELEQSISHGYAKRSGRTAIPFGLMLASTRYPWLSATPDALVTDDPKAARRALLINRTVGHLRAALRKHFNTAQLVHTLAEACAGWWPLQIKNIGMRSADDWGDGVPLYYRVQCMQEAIVFGANRTTGAALIMGQRLAWEDVEIDELAPLYAQLINLTRHFMQRHVDAREKPPIDGSHAARETVNALYPLARPESVTRLDADAMALAEERDALVTARTAAQKRIDAIDNQLRDAMTDHEAGLFPDGSGITLKTIHVKAYEVAARSERRLHRTKAKQGE